MASRIVDIEHTNHVKNEIKRKVYEETLTGRPHNTSVQKLPVTMEMWMQLNVMPRTQM